MVCIRHSTAFVTCYAHLSSMAVSKGMVVGQGQVIGARRHDRPHERRAPALRDARRGHGARSRAVPRRIAHDPRHDRRRRRGCRPSTPAAASVRHDGRVHANGASAGPHSIAALELLSDVLAGVDEEHGSDQFFSRLAEAVCRLAADGPRGDLQLRRRAPPRPRRRRARGRARGLHRRRTSPSSRRRSRARRSRRIASSRCSRTTATTSPRTSPSSSATTRSSTSRSSRPAAGSASSSPSPPPARRRSTSSSATCCGCSARPSRSPRRRGSRRTETERARELEERIDFARDIHDGVVQRLFGVSLALSSEQPLTAEARARCAAEVRAALGELRSALQRPLGRSSPPTGTTLAAELDRLQRRAPRPRPRASKAR